MRPERWINRCGVALAMLVVACGGDGEEGAVRAPGDDTTAVTAVVPDTSRCRTMSASQVDHVFTEGDVDTVRLASGDLLVATAELDLLHPGDTIRFRQPGRGDAQPARVELYRIKNGNEVGGVAREGLEIHVLVKDCDAMGATAHLEHTSGAKLPGGPRAERADSFVVGRLDVDEVVLDSASAYSSAPRTAPAPLRAGLLLLAQDTVDEEEPVEGPDSLRLRALHGGFIVVAN